MAGTPHGQSDQQFKLNVTFSQIPVQNLSSRKSPIQIERRVSTEGGRRIFIGVRSQKKVSKLVSLICYRAVS